MSEEKCGRCGGRLVANAQYKATGHTPGCFHSNRVKHPEPRQLAPRTRRPSTPAEKHQAAVKVLEDFKQWLSLGKDNTTPRAALTPARALVLLREEDSIRELLGRVRVAEIRKAAQVLA